MSKNRTVTNATHLSIQEKKPNKNVVLNTVRMLNNCKDAGRVGTTEEVLNLGVVYVELLSTCLMHVKIAAVPGE